MSLIQATIRNTKTKGHLNTLRKSGDVPGVIYGGENENEKISLSKKEVKNLINKENFLSNVISIKLNEKEQKVLPREITFDTISDEPTHIDFLRIVKGAKIVLEIPVRFINNELSPGLKRGGVLNIVRRKVELKCPTENIPTELVVDLEGLDIGASIKISYIKLPENVTPTIQGRDFVIATVAAPTIVKEPEKPEEAGSEAGAEGAEASGTESESKTTDATDKGADGDKPKENEKTVTEKK
ncbi:MAG: 50S ribosomal protein L25/general stress protein Ctc [Candidatus Pelagibacter sp.]